MVIIKSLNGHCSTVKNTARLRCHESGAWTEAALRSPRYRNEAGGAAVGGGGFIQQTQGAKSVFSTQNRAADEFEEKPWHVQPSRGGRARRQLGSAFGSFFCPEFRGPFWEEGSIPMWNSDQKKAEKCPAPGSHTQTHTRTHTSDTQHDHQTVTHTHMQTYTNFTKSCRWNVFCSLTQICFTVEWWWGIVF